LLASPLGFPQQSPSSLSVIYKREPLALLSIQCDTPYRVLVSQIDSNENVFRHVGLVSFFGFGFFLLRANPETGPFFYIVNSLQRRSGRDTRKYREASIEGSGRGGRSEAIFPTA
jgi:hypothetical protein